MHYNGEHQLQTGSLENSASMCTKASMQLQLLHLHRRLWQESIHKFSILSYNYLAGNPGGIKIRKVYFLLIYLQLQYNIRLESHCLPTHHLLFYIFYGL